MIVIAIAITIIITIIRIRIRRSQAIVLFLSCVRATFRFLVRKPNNSWTFLTTAANTSSLLNLSMSHHMAYFSKTANLLEQSAFFTSHDLDSILGLSLSLLFTLSNTPDSRANTAKSDCTCTLLYWMIVSSVQQQHVLLADAPLSQVLFPLHIQEQPQPQQG